MSQTPSGSQGVVCTANRDYLIRCSMPCGKARQRLSRALQVTCALVMSHACKHRLKQSNRYLRRLAIDERVILLCMSLAHLSRGRRRAIPSAEGFRITAAWKLPLPPDLLPHAPPSATRLGSSPVLPATHLGPVARYLHARHPPIEALLARIGSDSEDHKPTVRWQMIVLCPVRQSVAARRPCPSSNLKFMLTSGCTRGWCLRNPASDELLLGH